MWKILLGNKKQAKNLVIRVRRIRSKKSLKDDFSQEFKRLRELGLLEGIYKVKL